MLFENLFPSSGRDKRPNNFVPLEEFPSAHETPEETLIREDEEEQRLKNKYDVNGALDTDEYSDNDGVPPEGGTEYDRLIERAERSADMAVEPSEVPSPIKDLAEDIQNKMDVTGPRPSYRDQADEKFNFGHRPTHGWRGKEHPGKHQKGGDAIGK